MKRIKLLLLTLITLFFGIQLSGCPQGTVYVSFGQHVDFYHSYRGDSPTDDGFGADIEVITQTLDYLDKHPRVKMSWEFDSWQTLNHRLPEYAPDLFERIKARIAEKDEVRFQSWSGSVVSAETPEEFAAGIQWQRDNLLSIFGKVENGVYPQEMMHTPSLIRAYNDLGVKWVSLFYSACSFTAFRNEVKLSRKEQYNPLWLETPEGDARMILFPTYHHADVADFLGLATWADYVWRHVDGDALIFIAFDADGASWPLILELLLPGLEKLHFVKFCTPGEYLATHEPVGTVVLQRDQADGVFDGYSSWAEKPVNHDIWTAVEASRAGERRTRFLTDRFGQTSPEIDALLEQNFLERIITMKTTHFGLATPFLHPDREEAAYAHANEIRDLAGRALSLAEAKAYPHIMDRVGEPPTLPFPGSSHPYYVYRPAYAGGPSLVKIPINLEAGETLPKGLRVFRVTPTKATEEIPSGLLNLQLHPDGSLSDATLVFITDLGPGDEAFYWISRSMDPQVVPPDYGLVSDEAALLDNGLVRVEFDPEGWPVSLQRNALEFSGDRLINPGITFRKSFAGPDRLETRDNSQSVRQRGFFRELFKTGMYVVSCSGQDSSGSMEYRFRVFAGLPFVEIQAEVAYPGIQDTCLGAISESYPLGVLPDLSAERLRIWKHNYFDYTGNYDVTAPADSLNSHVTASWVALSDELQGLLLAYDAEQLAAIAFCPMKIKEGFFGRLQAVMNPFGSPWGSFPDHDVRRTGGSGLGELMTVLLGEQFEPSAKAYPGTTSRFSVILLPYEGDAPPEDEQELAEAYSYGPGYIALDQG